MAAVDIAVPVHVATEAESVTAVERAEKGGDDHRDGEDGDVEGEDDDGSGRNEGMIETF